MGCGIEMALRGPFVLNSFDSDWDTEEKAARMSMCDQRFERTTGEVCNKSQSKNDNRCHAGGSFPPGFFSLISL